MTVSIDENDENDFATSCPASRSLPQKPDRSCYSNMVAKGMITCWSFLATLIFHGLVQAQDATYYQAPAFTPPAVARIEVDKPSQKSDASVDENCSSFVMTPSLAKGKTVFLHCAKCEEWNR